jgi:hypothetical protein
MRHRIIGACALLGLGLLACGEPTATGMGRAEAVIQDAPPPAGPGVDGSLAGNVQVSVSGDGSTWVDLGSPNGITVPLQVSSGGTTVHGEVDAPAGTYSRVRLRFNAVTARLKSGSVIQGTTLTSDVNVTVGGSDQQVDVIVTVPSFTVTADADVRRAVVFDLRSLVWLTLAAVQAGVVEDAALQAAVFATTRVESR